MGDAQLISAIVTSAATVFLAIFTWVYVRQTKTMAASALEQTRIMRDTFEGLRSRNAAALRALAQRLRATTETMDKRGPSHEQLHSFEGVTDRDLADLESLAKDAGAGAPQLASQAVLAWRVILDLRNAAGKYSLSHGWKISFDETERYRGALAQAASSLQGLERFTAN